MRLVGASLGVPGTPGRPRRGARRWPPASTVSFLSGFSVSARRGPSHRILGSVSFLHIRVALQGQTLGKYKIIAPLGSGGFGTVYLAQDTWIDKKVAIKVPHRQGLDFGELLREPRLLASVSHPNIVAITTAEKQDNVFFIVMEYVPGETLENLIARRARSTSTARSTSPARSATPSITRTAGRHPSRPAAGQRARHRERHAEGRGLRDVALSRDRGARHDGDRQPAVHGAGAVPRQGGVRVDIYSLGVTMYQMLTGMLPYDTPAPADLDKLMSGELVSPPRLKNPSIPKAISDIVMRAMAPDVTARYQRRRTCSRTCSRRATPAPARGRRTPPDRRVPSAADGQGAFSRASRAREAPLPDGSAGSAASRSTRGPIAVRSAAKRSGPCQIRGFGHGVHPPCRRVRTAQKRVVTAP